MDVPITINLRNKSEVLPLNGTGSNPIIKGINTSKISADVLQDKHLGNNNVHMSEKDVPEPVQFVKGISKGSGITEKPTAAPISHKIKANVLKCKKFVATKNIVNTPQNIKQDSVNGECIYKEGKVVSNKILMKSNLPFKRKKPACINMTSDVLKNVKLLLTKEETVSSFIDISSSKDGHNIGGNSIHNASELSTQNVLNTTEEPICADIIFTSENAQSNDDTGHLHSETSCKDMGSLFEVNVRTDSVINSLDIKNDSQKATELLAETTQTKSNNGKGTISTNLESIMHPQSTLLSTSSQLNKRNPQQSKNCKIQQPSEQKSEVQQSVLFPPTPSVIKQLPQSGDTQALTPICVDGDVKIVMTKGKYYIQHNQQHNDHNVIVLSPLTVETLLPVLPVSEIYNGDEASTSDVPNCVAMDSDQLTDICAESTVCTTPSTDEIQAERRERLRLSKRALRMDPNYRAKESAQCRLRMQVKRLDPEYREKERQKDKIRRAKSRKQNVSLRNREKERDRAYQYYKKMQHNIHEAVMPLFLEEEVNCDLNEDIVVATANEDIDDTDSSLNL